MLPDLLLATNLLVTNLQEVEDSRKAYKSLKVKYLKIIASPKGIPYISNSTNESVSPEATNKPISLETLSKLVDANIQDWLSDLIDLLRSTDYDADFIRPTQYSIATILGLLHNASLYIDGPLPSGTIYPDGNGGLRIEWIRSNRELRLIVPFDESRRGYIYHEVGAKYASDYNVSANNLANWLNWLAANDQGAK